MDSFTLNLNEKNKLHAGMIAEGNPCCFQEGGSTGSKASCNYESTIGGYDFSHASDDGLKAVVAQQKGSQQLHRERQSDSLYK